MNKEIEIYNNAQENEPKAICNLLAKEIQTGLPKSESKVWHGSPVWFLDDNPITGYAVRKRGIQLLFWSGQSFDEPDLKPEGSFKAAEVYYTTRDHVNTDDLKRWLEKAQRIQWDYKNIVKRRGVLERV